MVPLIWPFLQGPAQGLPARARGQLTPPPSSQNPGGHLGLPFMVGRGQEAGNGPGLQRPSWPWLALGCMISSWEAGWWGR